MPAPVITLGRNFYAYKADNGVTYNIGTLDANAAAQTSPAAPVAPNANPTIPRGWKIRHVTGFYTTGGVTYTTILPIFDPTDNIWLTVSTTFTKWGTTYAVESYLGEKRIYRS